MRYRHGLDVIREEEDELGLPNMDELLEDEQYMYAVLPPSADLVLADSDFFLQGTTVSESARPTASSTTSTS